MLPCTLGYITETVEDPAVAFPENPVKENCNPEEDNTNRIDIGEELIMAGLALPLR